MPTETAYNEKELLRRVAHGDAHAFGLFFHSYNARLFPFVIKITKSTAIAEEIVQEVFLRAWVHREKLPQLDQPAAWLFRIASNLSLTHLRNTANEAIKHANFSNTAGEPVNEIADWLDMKEMAHLVEQAVSKMPPKRQTVFRLSRQQGLTHQQIAGELGISPNTVKEHMVQAVKFIREYIRRQTGTNLGIIVLVYLCSPLN